MNKLTSRCSFTQMTLDRASNKRKSDEWISAQLAQENCQIIPVWNTSFIFVESHLVLLQGEAKLKVLSSDVTSKINIQEKEQHLIFLGLNDAVPIFAIDISSVEEGDLANLFGDSAEPIHLRAALGLINHEQASILGFANNLLYWNKSNRFCGVCGTATQTNNGGHSIVCTNKECNKEIFPRTDPVVIMLIEYKPESGPAQCLLAEHYRSADKCVSTLAGFIDPAETLEQAVIREVKEEVGVNVFDVEYAKSQPWPFPSSLMLGFYAKANDPAIQLDDDEIRDAQWFTADEVRSFSNWGDEDENYKLPRKESIARYLIDTWLEAN
ncbi:NAD(+) diphosphatase [Pseudocolwellia sp. HL-MZ7]|uniref:NAD(+) diphosphatase n=1 Tax=Pseudocolwellia sp. HL-MZ7 TaxID=3400627 RepID=UPI003CFB21CA